MPKEQRLKGIIAENEETIWDLALRLHRRPEVGYAEFFAARTLAGFLRDRGFRVDLGIAGMPTAYRAEWGTSGPRVALMAEMDAMPGTGHSCGHNLMAAAAVGAAAGLAGLGKELPGRIVVLGAPAEEVGYRSGGKALLVREGYLHGIAAAMQIHPAESTYLRREYWPAWTYIEFTFRRGQTEVLSWDPGSRHPYEVLVEDLAADLGAIDLSVAAPPRGDAWTVGDRTELWMRFRLKGERASDLPGLEADALRRAGEYASELGLDVSARLGTNRYHDMIDSQSIGQVFKDHCESLGEPILDVAHPESQSLGDMGNVSQVVPSIHPFIGIGGNPRLHTEEYAEAVTTSGARRALRIGSSAMALTSLDLMENTALRDAAWREFLSEDREA